MAGESPSSILSRAADLIRDTAQRLIQNYRQWHVDDRCQPEGCDCPCGYCKHDRRHVPGVLGVQEEVSDGS